MTTKTKYIASHEGVTATRTMENNTSTPAMTVREVLRRIDRDEPSALLTDGAQDWDADNLLRTLEAMSAPELDRECVWDWRGVTLLDERGYQASQTWLAPVTGPDA